MSVNKLPEEDLRDAIIYFIKERHVSIPKILEDVDISRSRLYDYLQGNGKISATSFANIIITIGVTSDEIIAHIFRANRSLIIPVLREQRLTGKDIVAPTKETVEVILETFEETDDINLLKELAIAINTMVPSKDQQRRLMDMIIPTINHVYRKRRFYTIIDATLYANILPFIDYAEAKRVAGILTEQIDGLAVIDVYGIEAVNKVMYSIQHIYGLIHINLVMLALENDDTTAAKESLERIRTYQISQPDYYFGMCRRVAEVIQLVLDEDYITAEKLYNQTLESVEFIMDNEFANSYRQILGKNFDSLIEPVQEYLDRQ